ncbi:MAG TPA: hypothetical protein VFU05_05905 [Cyclobacteriaceae bacterium]|nr:hypothetical protein [Cyclobacteriaceae bacterium]
MKRFKPSQKLLIFIYVVGILLFCHHFIFRPIILDWGATTELKEMTFSGDTFTGGTGHTRSVLIQATPEEIWSWLIQIGQDRGGFYSYQWLENLFQADMKNVYSIQPEFQVPRHVGDTIWLANRDHYNGGGYQILAEVIPAKSFVMMSGEDYLRVQEGSKALGSWAFYLYPEAANQTWLVVRSSEGDVHFGNKILRYFFFEVPHFMMERKMLVTMRKLAENEQVTSATGQADF